MSEKELNFIDRIRQVFELMEKHNIETFNYKGLEVTRKSLELMQQADRKEENIRREVKGK